MERLIDRMIYLLSGLLMVFLASLITYGIALILVSFSTGFTLNELDIMFLGVTL